MELTENQEQVLGSLDTKKWLRPLDIGGRNGSHHSRTLQQLVKHNLVERRERSPGGSRPSYVYRLTKAGVAALDGMPIG